MQRTWPTFALGLIFGAGMTLLIGFAIDARFPAFAAFCDQKETLLTCSRNWANAFAILAGAAVVVVTLRGQREERERHKQTIRIGQGADALRARRSINSEREMSQAADEIDAIYKVFDREMIATKPDLYDMFCRPMNEACCRIQNEFLTGRTSILRDLFDEHADAASHKLASELQSAVNSTVNYPNEGVEIGHLGGVSINLAHRTRYALQMFDACKEVPELTRKYIEEIEKLRAAFEA
jgi:hypothetical protein